MSVSTEMTVLKHKYSFDRPHSEFKEFSIRKPRQNDWEKFESHSVQCSQKWNISIVRELQDDPSQIENQLESRSVSRIQLTGGQFEMV